MQTVCDVCHFFAQSRRAWRFARCVRDSMGSSARVFGELLHLFMIFSHRLRQYVADLILTSTHAYKLFDASRCIHTGKMGQIHPHLLAHRYRTFSFKKYSTALILLAGGTFDALLIRISCSASLRLATIASKRSSAAERLGFTQIHYGKGCKPAHFSPSHGHESSQILTGKDVNYPLYWHSDHQ